MKVVTTRWERENDIWDFTMKWSHPLIPLLRTLLRRPGLTKHMRTIFCLRKISTPTREGEIKKNGHLTLPNPPLEDVIAIVARTSLPYRDTWLQHLEACRQDAYLAFLFTQLPWIQYLQLDDNTYLKSDLVRAVLGSLLFQSETVELPPFALPGSLLNLRRVEVHRKAMDCRDWEILATQHIRNACDLSFFRLPLAKELILNLDLMDVKDVWAGAGIPPPPADGTKIEKIQLEGPRETHLAHLFSFTHRLRSFHWMWCWYYTQDPRGMHLPCNTPTIALDLLIPVLRLVRDTLTELNIHATTDDTCGITRPRITGSTGGLSSLLALRKLTIPFCFLTGLEVPIEDIMAVAKSLPRNLEILTLRTDLYTDVTQRLLGRGSFHPVPGPMAGQC